MIAACIAEMASASPSSAGVYQWASITAGKHGRIVGYFAGWYVILYLLKHPAVINTSPCHVEMGWRD
jgi:amino acid transporter